MAKSDAPPLSMKIERGPTLVPATAFDAERLDSYRVGSSVRIQFVETAGRVGIRKWWAALNRAVKDCNTPWKNSQQASEAIKLALGIVNYGKTTNGKFMQWPRSLTELDDAELEDAVRDMMDLLHSITGVDPAEWRKETPDVGRDEPVSPDDPLIPASGEGSGEAFPLALEPAPTKSADAAGRQEDGEIVEAPSSIPEGVLVLLMEECVDNMLREAISLPKDKQITKINDLEKIFLESQNLGSRPAFVKRCAETARRIAGNPNEKERAATYLKGLIK